MTSAFLFPFVSCLSFPYCPVQTAFPYRLAVLGQLLLPGTYCLICQKHFCRALIILRLILMRLLFLCLLFAGSAFAQSALELEVLSRTNQVRTERGLRPLQWDGVAHKTARGHALDMLERNFFAHVNPDGLKAADRMYQAGIVEVEVGENLAFYENHADATIPRKSLEGWMNSPGHRANLLKPEFTHLGVSLERKGDRVMVVQNFISRPFDPRLARTSSTAERTLLSISGQAPGTLGVFVGSGLYARLEPKFNTTLELPPGAKPSYGLFDGEKWWNVKPGQRGVEVNGGIKLTQAKGVRLQLTLPPGSYSLGVGNEPRFWQSLSGPQNLDLTLPETLEILWIGKVTGSRVNYILRIPLIA